MSTEQEIVNAVPKSLPIAEKGIETAEDVILFMSAIAADVIARRITTQQAQAGISSQRLSVRTADLQRKHGVRGPDGRMVLQLTHGQKRE